MKSTTTAGPEKGATLEAALRYAGLGWAVFPVHSVKNGVCTCRKGADCGAAGKHPRTEHGVKDATMDPEKIRAWWGRWPDASIAVAAGKASGIVVLDIDGAEGRESLKKLSAELGNLPPAPTAKTGRGWHLFFRWPGRKVRNRIGAAPGIDIRADGGYVVVPPSKHASGAEYVWNTPPEKVPPPELPHEWLEYLSAGCYTESAESAESAEGSEGAENAGESRECRRSRQPKSSVILRSSTDFAGAVEKAILETLPRKAGERHRKVFELARRLKAIAALAELPAKKLRPTVRDWHRRALGVIRTKDWETTWFDFTDAWGRVRVPGGGSVVDALEKVKAGPLPAAALQYDNPKLQLLVGICRELQRLAGDQPFFLSCETAAQVLGEDSDPSAMTVWRWLGGLVRDGVLRLEKKGDRRKANEYHYLAEM